MRTVTHEIASVGTAVDSVEAWLNHAAQIDMTGSNPGIDQADTHLRLSRQAGHRQRDRKRCGPNQSPCKIRRSKEKSGH